MDTFCEPTLSFFDVDEPVCPYTGLRTFTEDEALYFKGREAHVAKCLTRLARHRFLMITGASGDGKSSLVYAGLLPEIRAGFVRARYSSWAVATFRPERSPLRNMARAVAAALRLEQSAATVETELSQGFSALVQLYQASSLCPPDELPADLLPAEQRRQRTQAANLLVVVDQFEEFFTNPENYAGNSPNAAAQTVVNLLLETTRLVQEQNLPIYIVCTMRSDFVGQCAEFRGLIEQVGESQYFVPRLLRHEFVEVIREPAALSGSRISERLVQRLVYDIQDGQDQLPVLQHALHRIWMAADQGREEMDLIHYAMVGGFSGVLPAADQARFEQWRAGVPAWQQTFLLTNCSLRNVLDAHANQLYTEATELYNQAYEPALAPGTAQQVIEKTLRVLTRADGPRVVRNRLSGAEITAILADAALPWPVVCRILRPFRAEGATFLSPFLLAGDDDPTLPPDTVLDITHESLIRNWARLAGWAASEAEDVRVVHDLLHQAERWQASRRDTGFLLPIGPYTFFSEWSRRKQGNASWLAHYVATGPDTAHRQEQATQQSQLLTSYLEASRRRLQFSLLVARYHVSRRTVAAVLLLPLLLLGLVWYGWVARKRKADYVAHSIVRSRTNYLASPDLLPADKANFIIQTDRLKHYTYQPLLGGKSADDHSFPRQLDALANDTLALDTELALYTRVSNVAYDSIERENPWARRLLFDLDRRLDRAGSIEQPTAGAAALSEQQRQLALHTARAVMTLTHYLLYTDPATPGVKPRVLRRRDNQPLYAMRRKLLRRLRGYVRREVQTTEGAAPNAVKFGFCLRVLLSQGQDTADELAFLNGLNPLNLNSPARRQFLRFFPATFQEKSTSGVPSLRKYELHLAGGSIEHSGGYQTSAIIFAALRQPAALLQCLDSLQRQTRDIDDADGGIALLPYLIKYELLTPDSLYPLLRRCARLGAFSFNEMYAATAYCLLSVSPSLRVSELYVVDPNKAKGRSPDLLNYDRASFSIPLGSRDKAWTALAAATGTIAAQEPLFMEPGHSSPAFTRRNTLFLQAFLAKMHGVYLAELKRQPAAAAQRFAAFAAAVEQLKTAYPAGAIVNEHDWNFHVGQVVNIIGPATVGRDPVRFLQLPIRPKTQLFETYLTCPFDAFFRFELEHAAAQPRPDAGLVQLLDSVAFVEAAFPDRYSGTRERSLRAEALSRLRESVPNMAWISAIHRVAVPGLPAARAQRNALLFELEQALQSPAHLAALDVPRRVLPQVRLLPTQPAFAQVPLQMALSDVAAALARNGRPREAFELAAALPAPMNDATHIRIGEQLMMRDNREEKDRLDAFLDDYRRRLTPRPADAAASVLPLLYWRPYLFDSNTGFYDFAALITKEGSGFAAQNGGFYMCKGRSLADDSYRAVQGIPAYEAEYRRQRYYNYVLAGLAHLKTARPNDGWREYDEKVLLRPADYDGPAE
ncbi:hypothetical protein GCM10027048_05470 [Hymenobacter coalescens]